MFYSGIISSGILMSDLIRIERVYYVDRTNTTPVMDWIAIRPMIDFDDSFILWSDHSRQRLVWFHHLHADEIETWTEVNEHPPKTITIDDEEGHQIVLRELTVDRYEQFLEREIRESAHFQSTEEMQSYFLKQKPSES